ncbi:hypothetical protein RIF29_28500 [Crotalaria pallida]|uniref:Uncharacterized protein n=1 Tax=Crotalaria pallida TaxID=3830 RepID=A0AAN9HV35_CROPI
MVMSNILAMFVAVAAITNFSSNASDSEEAHVFELIKQYREIEAELRRQREKGKMLKLCLSLYRLPIDNMNPKQLDELEASLKRLKQQIIKMRDDDSANTSSSSASFGRK